MKASAALISSIIVLAISISSAVARAAPTDDRCEAEIAAAARDYGIPEGILYSIGLTETGRAGSMRPYAMNIEGEAYFASSAAEAVARFRAAERAGKVLVDLGCMQINHHYHREQFASLEAMLDPHENVRYAARFLAELRQRHSSWTMAVARYHAGPDNDPAQKRYVCRVIANLVATGYGAWTPEARSFCG